MDKFKLPTEYKDFYHIKDEDLENLNRHIEHFEKDSYRKKVLSRWFFLGIVLVVIVSFVLGVFDITYIKKLFGFKKFLVKEVLDFDGKKVNVRVSMPVKGIANVILEPINFKGYICISNAYEVKNVFISDVESLNVKYDKEIFFIFDNVVRKMNIDIIDVME